MSFCSCMGAQQVHSEPTIPSLLLNKKKQKLGSIRLGGPLGVTQHRHEALTREQGTTLLQSYIDRIVVSSPPVVRFRAEERMVGRPVMQSSQPRETRNVRSPLPEIEQETSGTDVRRSLDKNLSLIYKQLRERKQAKIQAQREIPTLPNKLVVEYINTIYRDYNIPDPLGEIKHKSQHESLAETLQAIHKRSVSTNANKRAVKLKQSFIIDMFSPSENRYQESTNKRNSYGEGNTRQFSQDSKKYDSTHKKMSSALRSDQQKGHVKELYRFCFVCEYPILECNIWHHEKEECPQFSSLYSMTLQEIREAIRRKIEKLQEEIEGYLRDLCDPESRELRFLNQFEKLYDQTNIYLSLLSQSIEKGDQISKAEIKYRYSQVIDCYEASYFKLYESLKKIHWFSIMLKNLEIKYAEELREGEL